MRRYGRRRFRAKSHWLWADSQLMTLDGATGSHVGGRCYNANLILPPGRVKWMCDQVIRRAHVTVTGVLLWLDFYWSNTGAQTGLPDVDMYIDTTSEDDAGNIQFVRDPFFQPQVPSAMAAWTDAASDGLDSFMWTHHIKGISPPNAIVDTDTSTGDQAGGNQYDQIRAGTTDTPQFVCRTFSVRAEWQPDLHVKTKRRLRPNEGLVLGMVGSDADFPAGNAALQAHLRWNVRIVAR